MALARNLFDLNKLGASNIFLLFPPIYISSDLKKKIPAIGTGRTGSQKSVSSTQIAIGSNDQVEQYGINTWRLVN